jgi:hypothetical protein
LACEVIFGSGSLQGFFANDEVSLGIPHMGPDGVVHNKLTVKNQAFGLITSESVLDDTFDCICGLAYPSMANTGSINGTPLFDTMMQ